MRSERGDHQVRQGRAPGRSQQAVPDLPHVGPRPQPREREPPGGIMRSRPGHQVRVAGAPGRGVVQKDAERLVFSGDALERPAQTRQTLGRGPGAHAARRRRGIQDAPSGDGDRRRVAAENEAIAPRQGRRRLEPQPRHGGLPGLEGRRRAAHQGPDSGDACEDLGRPLVKPHAGAVPQRRRRGKDGDDDVDDRCGRQRPGETSASPRARSATSAPLRFTATRSPTSAAGRRAPCT